MTDDQKAPSASLATGDNLTPGSWADFVARLRHDCVGKGVEDHYTADAIFIVQARRRIYGIDSDYTDTQCVVFDGTCWHSPEEYWGDLEDDEKRELDEKADDEFGSAFLSLDERDQWRCLAELPEHTVTGWDETWEYVNSHFTKDAAEAFIRRKKHDYRDGLRVYVDAQIHCWEYNTIKAAILDGRIGPITTPASVAGLVGRQQDLRERERPGAGSAYARLAAELPSSFMSSRPDDLERINRQLTLAYKIADESAVALLECNLMNATLGGLWLDTASAEPADDPAILEAIEYLELRGMLEHHPTSYHLVRIIEKETSQ